MNLSGAKIAYTVIQRTSSVIVVMTFFGNYQDQTIGSVLTGNESLIKRQLLITKGG